MEKEEKLELIKIIISALLFVIALITKIELLKTMCFLFSYIVISYEMYIESFQNIRKGNIFDENFLMIIATLGAFYIGSYEEGVLVILLFQIGEFLSDIAVSKSKQSITDLMDLRVEEVELEDKSTVPVEKVKIGEHFLVKPGDKIPLDGKVIKGESYLDTSSITGESKPKKVKEKDLVLSGCINRESVLIVEATTTYETSTAQKIIELMEKEEEKKSNTEKWITKFAKVYTPVIIIISAIIFIIPVIMGQEPKECLYKSLVFIVTSCPCALVISVPLGYFCGIGKASKEGILIKGANELETLSTIDHILLDKTGTITEGIMKVSSINTNTKEKEFLQLIASAEENSNHPIANAIKEKNKEKIKKVTDYKEIPGMGISCKIGKKEIIVGNDKLMNKYKVEYEEIDTPNTIIHCAVDNKYQGNIIISDKIKESSYELKKWNEKLVILSGDNERIVKEVAEELKIKEYYGDLLPKDKVEITKKYKEKGKVLFIGDGINDAPVINMADIGVSLGNIGTDAALEASDMVLMDDNISKIRDAIAISKYTHKKIMQSIIMAFVVKIVVLTLGLLGISTILMAVFADVGVTLLAVLNVLCIFLKKKKEV